MKAKYVELEAYSERQPDRFYLLENALQIPAVTAAVLESLKESDTLHRCEVCRANGSQECKKKAPFS